MTVQQLSDVKLLGEITEATNDAYIVRAISDVKLLGEITEVTNDAYIVRAISDVKLLGDSPPKPLLGLPPAILEDSITEITTGGILTNLPAILEDSITEITTGGILTNAPAITQTYKSIQRYLITFNLYNPPKVNSIQQLSHGDPIDLTNFIIPETRNIQQSPHGDPTDLTNFVIPETRSIQQLPYGDPVEWPYKAYQVDFNIIEAKKTYQVDFFIASPIIEAYQVSFNIALGNSYPVDFNILKQFPEKISYDQILFSILDGSITKRLYDVDFDISQLQTFYDVFFNIQPLPETYAVDFTIAEGGVVWEADILFDIIKIWVATTVPVRLTPYINGTIPISTRKRRVVARVYTEDGSNLICAGYIAIAFDGWDNFKIHVIVEEIPVISNNMRVLIYDNRRRVIDEVVPSSEIWEGNYGIT